MNTRTRLAIGLALAAGAGTSAVLYATQNPPPPQTINKTVVDTLRAGDTLIYTWKIVGASPTTPPPVIPPPVDTTTPPVTPPGSLSCAGSSYCDDFSKYTTTAQLNSGVMAQGNFWWGPNTTRAAGHDYVNINNASSISLDKTEQALRYDWPNRSTSPCTGSEVSTFINPRQNPIPAGTKNIWVRFVSKESAGFSHGNPGCGGKSYKFFLLNFERSGGGMLGRAGLYLGDGVPQAPLGPNDQHLSTTAFMDISDQKGAYQYKGGIQMGGAAGWGGAYHTWTMEVLGVGTANAVFSTYLDGVKIHTLNSPFLNGESVGNYVLYFSMGANMNSGPSKAQSRWFKHVSMYFDQKPAGIP